VQLHLACLLSVWRQAHGGTKVWLHQSTRTSHDVCCVLLLLLCPAQGEEAEEEEEQQGVSDEDADMDDAERAADARMGYTADDQGTRSGWAGQSWLDCSTCRYLAQGHQLHLTQLC
jgi:hypothetical protein